jgi:hypothetical protein
VPASLLARLRTNWPPAQNLLPEWSSHELHPIICRSLHSRGFMMPTPIQAQTLPYARKGHDVVGVAETVSSKRNSSLGYIDIIRLLGIGENARVRATHSHQASRGCTVKASPPEATPFGSDSHSNARTCTSGLLASKCILDRSRDCGKFRPVSRYSSVEG